MNISIHMLGKYQIGTNRYEYGYLLTNIESGFIHFEKDFEVYYKNQSKFLSRGCIWDHVNGCEVPVGRNTTGIPFKEYAERIISILAWEDIFYMSMITSYVD